MSSEKKTLVLLIGTNPLPNYVVAMNYLSGNSDYTNELICIYSDAQQKQSSTKQYADKLTEVLSLELKKPVSFIPIDLENISSRELIQNSLEKYYSNNLIGKNMHLNYTGGTKTMAVHVYNYFYEKFDEMEFSYLDARDNILHWHKKNNEKDEKPLPDISNKFGISLENLLKLHNHRFYNKFDENDISFIPAKNCFTEFDDILTATKYNYLQLNTIKKFLHNYNKKTKKYLLEINTFQKYKDYYNSTDFKAKLTQYIKIVTKLKYLTLDNIEFINLNKLTFEKTVYPSIDYFKGDKYFEHLCYTALEQAINEYNQSNGIKITEYGTSIECIKIPKASNETVKNFELDAYFLKGIQFFGISCTTSDVRSTIKSKGFEIIHRSKQIGGEEARAVMIYREKDKYEDPDDHPKHLQTELEQDTGTSQNRFYMKPFIDIDTLKQDFIKMINDN